MVMVHLPFEMVFASDGCRYSCSTGRQASLLRGRPNFFRALALLPFPARHNFARVDHASARNRRNECAAQHHRDLPPHAASSPLAAAFGLKLTG
jgi:hypothetical protein